jgi:Bacterial Ig domain
VRWVPFLLLFATAFPATAQAASRQINFDEAAAPCLFSEQPEKLTTRYASMGVTFSGPAADHGAEIVDQCGGFGVSGFSAPNFLALNAALTSENVDGPETLHFSPAADVVEIKVGSPEGGTVTMTAFDEATVVAESSRTLSSTLTSLSTAGSHITSVRVASPANVLVMDDLVWSSPPVATGDSYSVAQGKTLVSGSPGVLANDSDADGDPLTAELVGGAGHGTLDLHPAGDFTYTPSPEFSGQDSFVYRAVGAGTKSAPTTVTITVTPTPTPTLAPTLAAPAAPPRNCTAATAALKAAKGKVNKAKRGLSAAQASAAHAQSPTESAKALAKVKQAKKALEKATKALKKAQAAPC